MVDIISTIPYNGISNRNNGASETKAQSYYCHPASVGEDLELGDGSSPSTHQQHPAASSSSSPQTPRFPQFQFRSIRPSDRRGIQELHEEWFPVRYQSEFYDDLVHGKMCHSGEDLYTLLAVDRDEKIVACLVAAMVPAKRLNFNSRQLLLPDHRKHSMGCYIMTLGTVEEHRKTGLATYLIERCIQELVRDQPCVGSLYLHVITSNESAIRFYERLGFWRVQEIQDYYTIADKYHNCYLYAKYFHGNRLDLFQLISWWVSNVWKKIKTPLTFLFLKESSRRRIISDNHRA
eukprot:CAMPEP_0176005302 /NCGR_PEP_ID=MMETSP0120_2-20121206/2135_1 /TAXON_ID=160619 /ORGANISM="Kryptoperidinium foliaceum, Strain CCMP 1326" /LENGTH=290 /DNA_ID=CAMNT_0017338003 /DNA_START=138 /DNA_END=1010 /DNA_ORIENTATION=-